MEKSRVGRKVVRYREIDTTFHWNGVSRRRIYHVAPLCRPIAYAGFTQPFDKTFDICVLWYVFDNQFAQIFLSSFFREQQVSKFLIKSWQIPLINDLLACYSCTRPEPRCGSEMGGAERTTKFFTLHIWPVREPIAPSKASVLMQRLSYPTQAVLSNKINKNRVIISSKDSPRKPLGRRPPFSCQTLPRLPLPTKQLGAWLGKQSYGSGQSTHRGGAISKWKSPNLERIISSCFETKWWRCSASWRTRSKPFSFSRSPNRSCFQTSWSSKSIGWEDHQKFDLDQRSRSTYWSRSLP